MASTFQELRLAGLTLSPALDPARIEALETAFEQNRYRIYAFSFWVTDNEMAAEEMMAVVFRRALHSGRELSSESLDRALIAELRETMPIGVLTLNCAPATEVVGARRNTLRAHLERAVVALPATERLIYLMHDGEGYDHARIARTMGVTEDESRLGLHQARLRLRELLEAMQR